MKNLLKRINCSLLALFIAIALLPASIDAAPSSSKIYTDATGYDEASDVVYVKSTVSGKQIIANWGARGEDCVFLSTYAQDYYTGEYSFETLSALSGGSGQSDAPSSQLYSELQELMESTHTFYTYYDGNKNVRSYYKYTDCVSSDTSQVALFYRGGLVTSSWNSGSIWNQEHMWPQSKLSSSQQIGDIGHLRPANPSENSSRGNTSYGIGSGYYDPGVSVRGDCARTVLYMYVRWGTTGTMWGSSGVIQSVDVLLEWMEEDPVDTWEMGRNDAVQSITGNRNVFVDYPEFAWLLFGRDVPEGITTPSDNDGVTANPGDTSSPPTTTPTTTTPTTTTPATTAPATTAPATTAPATTAPATSTPATSTPASQPNATENTLPGTTATQPSSPVPMSTAHLDPNDFYTPSEDGNDYSLIIILAIAGVAVIVAGVVIFLVVGKSKKKTAPTAESIEEAPTKETE